MRTSRFGQLLLVVGGAVGVAAVVGLVVGFEPATLPPSLLNLAVYKLTFAAAAGLLAAGAIVHRYSERDTRSEAIDSEASFAPGKTRNELGKGAAPDHVAPTSRQHTSDAHEVS